MTKNWTVTLDDYNYEIIYQYDKIRATLTVDGYQINLIRKNQIIPIYEEEFYIGEVKLNFTAIGERADVAIDNIYIESRKPYKGIEKISIKTKILVFVVFVFLSLIGKYGARLAKISCTDIISKSLNI